LLSKNAIFYSGPKSYEHHCLCVVWKRKIILLESLTFGIRCICVSYAMTCHVWYHKLTEPPVVWGEELRMFSCGWQHHLHLWRESSSRYVLFEKKVIR
jgi:hypothetical protein